MRVCDRCHEPRKRSDIEITPINRVDIKVSTTYSSDGTTITTMDLCEYCITRLRGAIADLLDDFVKAEL